MAARKRRRDLKPGENGATSLYPPGTPVNPETGMPYEGGTVSAETARKVGFDPESARKRKKFRDVIEAKAAGEKRVKWDADPRLKYLQIASYAPSAFVSVKQVAPVVDDYLEDQSVRSVTTYGELKKYVKDNHWKGDKATYVFEMWSASEPIIGEGLIQFDADPEWTDKKEEEMARRGYSQQQNPQQQYPQQQYGPPQGGGYGGYPPPGYGYPPQAYAYPPPQQPGPTIVMPQPIQQQAPAPMPTPPGPNSDTNVFLQYLIAQVEWSRQEIARLQTLSSQPQQQHPQQADPQQWLAWHNAERSRWETEQAARTAAAVPPAPPVSPLDQMKQTVEMIRAVTSARESIVSVGQERRENPEAKGDGEDDFPVMIKQVGPYRMVADRKTGELLQDPVTTMMFNADNIESAGKRLMEKAETFMKDRAKDNEAVVDKQLELEKLRVASAREKSAMATAAADAEERIARARQMVLSAPPPVPQPISQVQAEKIAMRPTVVADEIAQRPNFSPPPWASPSPSAPVSAPIEEPVVENVLEGEPEIPDTEPPPAREEASEAASVAE